MVPELQRMTSSTWSRYCRSTCASQQACSMSLSCRSVMEHLLLQLVGDPMQITAEREAYESILKTTYGALRAGSGTVQQEATSAISYLEQHASPSTPQPAPALTQ
jgi:hypothetical protein